jgi:hypothetical protein
MEALRAKVLLQFGPESVVFPPAVKKHEYQNIEKSKFCLRFCMGVKLGLSHVGKNLDWRWLRKGHEGEYLDLRGRK